VAPSPPLAVKEDEWERLIPGGGILLQQRPPGFCEIAVRPPPGRGVEPLENR
jgi:hypothetical protein